MTYTVNLNRNQQLMIVNQGTQTLITLISSSPGQQQSQSSSVNTGNWTTPPQLYKIASGFILQLNSDREFMKSDQSIIGRYQSLKYCFIGKR